MYLFSIEVYDISKQLNHFWKEKDSCTMPAFTFFWMLVNTHTLDCLFLILPAEMKNKSGTKDQLCSFCFLHPNLLLYFCIHRVCVISSRERQLSSSVPSAISALPVEKPRRSRVAEQQFEYPYLTLQTTEDTSEPCVRQNAIKVSIIKPLFSCTPEVSSS